MKADDKLLEQYISEIKSNCEIWQSMVKTIGNQCSSTDRKIDSILEWTDKLKAEYSKIGL